MPGTFLPSHDDFPHLDGFALLALLVQVLEIGVGDKGTVGASGEELGSWELEFKRAGAPVGSGDRVELNTREVVGGSDTQVTGQIRMGSVPATPGNTPATVSGTWTAKKGTTINSLQLLVVKQ